MKLLFILIILLQVACGGGKSTGEPDSFIIQPSSASGLEYQLNEGDITNKIIGLSFTSGITGELNYSSFNIDAVAKSDYLPISGILQVSAGNEYTIDVEVFADERVEGDEKVGVSVTSIADNFTAEFIVTITNDDLPVYEVNTVDITEGNTGTQLAKVVITLKESTVDPYHLILKTLQADAIGYGLEGSDYVAFEQELVFLEGELSKEINLEVFGDLLIEPNELIEFVISHKGVTSSPYSVSIRTDDFPGQGAPTFIVNRNLSLPVVENETNQIFQMPFSIDDTGGFSEPFTLFYYLREVNPVDVGATDISELDQDFLLSKTPINISPGQIDYIAEFSVIDDDDLENVEVFELVLANDAGVVFGSGRIYISDNESPSFKIYRKYTDSFGNLVTSNDLQYLESSNGIGEHKIVVELLGNAGYDFEFEYVLRLASAGEVSNAIEASDWVQTVSGSIVQSNRLIIEKGNSLPGGSETNGISFTINSDTLVEGNESFFFELKNINGSSIGDAVEVKILNDDLPNIKWVNDNITLPATVPSPFKVREGDDLNLNIKLMGTSGLGDAALETFNIIINRQNSNTAICAWRDSSDLANDELIINNEFVQFFNQAATNIAIRLQSLEDNEVECDESLSLEVILSSNNPGVSQITRDEIIVTVVNDDISQLDVYGYSVSEALTSADFVISFSSDLELDIELLLDYAGAESSDANHVFNSAAVNVGSGTKMVYQFDESLNQRDKAITSHIINDDIVERDESYQLSVFLKLSSSSIPIELRQCVVGNVPECIVITDQTLPAIVLGTIKNDDKASLSLVAKGSETVLENTLTAMALMDSDVSFPYKVELDKTIASDVPAITLSLTDRCLLMSSENCASADDYSILTTDIHDGINETAAGTFDLQFRLLLDDAIVEPDEVAKLLLTLNNNLALTDYVLSGIDQTVDFNFTDDDKLTLTIVDTGIAAPVAMSYSEGTDGSNLSLSYGISWDKDIASNVPQLSINITEVCDESLNDICIKTIVNSNLISGDITGNSNVVIHDGSGLTPINNSGLTFNVGITGDNIVEPDESAILRVSLDNSIIANTYVVNASWPDENISFSLNNDDKLIINATTLSSSITEGAVGDQNSAGVLLSWDKHIAENVDNISLTLSEQCDNTSNNRCVSDVLNQDIKIPNTTIDLHRKNVATAAVINQNMGVIINGDHIVEPNENIELLLSLQNSVSLNQYLLTPWINQVINLTIANDDVLTPKLAFFDDADIAEGKEDTDKNLSSGNNVGLKLTWGNAVIADNTDDLLFEIVDACTNCGLVDSDYTIDRDDINLVSQVSGDQINLGFIITADSIVEPNEVVSIDLLKKTSTPSHYFSSVPAANKFSELHYTINNDERLRIQVVRTDGLTTSSLPENQSSPLSFSWLGHAASNLPILSLSHVEECDNDDSNNTLQKCLAQSTGLNNSPEDISLAASSIIKANGSEQNASIVPETGILAIVQNDDSWVEIDEVLKLRFSIPIDIQDYLRFDSAGSSESSPDYESEKIYTLLSDDVLNVSFDNSSSSGAITDESAAASINYTLGFDKSVEQDVGVLALEFIDASTAGQRYAIRSTDFFTAPDYRVFFAGQTAEHIVDTVLEIKAAGESLIVSSKQLSITVGDDDLVEANEVVAFSLKENNAAVALIDNGVELTQNVASSERSFTILLEDQLIPAIHFAADLNTTETVSQAEADINQNVSAIVFGLVPIDSNVGMLTLNASITCKTSMPMTCSNTEATINANINLAPDTLTASSIIDLGFMITGDQVVEPDEILTLTLSASSNTEYFDFTPMAIRDFTILNDDFLSISLTNDSSPLIEGDLLGTASIINLMVADEGAGIEGLDTIDYSISQNVLVGQNNAEDTGGKKDFSFLGSFGNRSIDLTSMQAPSTNVINQPLVTVTLDHYIEADEVLDITISLSVNASYLSSSAITNLNGQYTITDDDFLTVVMKDLAAQEEDSESLRVLICDKQGGGVESDFTLDFSTQSAFLNTVIDEYLPPEKRAILNDDFSVNNNVVSVSNSDISNSNIYLTHYCALKNIPVDITTDGDLENNEWFGFSLSSTTDYLCSSTGNNCLQQNVVIINDEILPILDTGVTHCITSTGSVVSPVAEACTELSIQDVEVDYPLNQYTYIDSTGTPLLSQWPASIEIPPADYHCIQDNFSGLFWSTARLPFNVTYSADGKAWQGTILNNGATFEGLFSTNGFCHYQMGSKKWQFPSVEQLLSIINYEHLEEDGSFLPGEFIHEELASDSIYWSKNSCDTDTDVTTKEYWAVNMKKGTVTCKPETDQYLLRAVYY
jgi:hypothetical protein